MYAIKPTIYEKMGGLLVEQIDQGDQDGFFSGSISLSEPEADYTFESSMLVNYRIERCPEADYTVISDIVPVWWEMHTTLDDGEVINDFDFNLLKRWVCN